MNPSAFLYHLLISYRARTFVFNRTPSEMFVKYFLGLCMVVKYAACYGQCVASVKLRCPPAWSQWNNRCYKILATGQPWSEARQSCLEMGAEMVFPSSKEEFEHLISMLTYFWIDYNDLQNEGKYT